MMFKAWFGLSLVLALQASRAERLTSLLNPPAVELSAGVELPRGVCEPVEIAGEEAIKLSIEQAKEKIEGGTATPMVWLGLAMSCTRLGRTDEARGAYERSILEYRSELEGQPKNAVPRYKLGKAICAYATDLAPERIQEGIDELRDALGMNPKLEGVRGDIAFSMMWQMLRAPVRESRKDLAKRVSETARFADEALVEDPLAYDALAVLSTMAVYFPAENYLADGIDGLVARLAKAYDEFRPKIDAMTDPGLAEAVVAGQLLPLFLTMRSSKLAAEGRWREVGGIPKVDTVTGDDAAFLSELRVRLLPVLQEHEDLPVIRAKASLALWSIGLTLDGTDDPELFEGALPGMRDATAWTETRALFLASVGELKLAREELWRLIDEDETPRAWMLLGSAEARYGVIQAAVDAFEHALEIDRDNADALVSLAIVKQRLGVETSELLSYVRRALETEPDHGDARFTLAVLYGLLDRNDDARRELKDAAELMGDDPRPGMLKRWL